MFVGMQCNMFSETIRTMEQLESNMFPRMLAFAERAWHQAAWENVTVCGEQCDTLKQNDWNEFANTLGYKELRRLSDLGVKYYIPPPGARLAKLKCLHDKKLCYLVFTKSLKVLRDI